MPRASPETTTNPAAPRSRASCAAIFAPAAEALREPTIATIGRASAESLPRTASSGGASSISARRAGYAASRSPTKQTLSARAASSSRSASAREQILTIAAPPRRASSGNCASAERALP